MLDWYDYMKDYAERMEGELDDYWGVQREKGKARYIRETYPDIDDLLEELETCVADADCNECDCESYSQEEFEELLHDRAEQLIKTYYRVAAERKYFEWKTFYGRKTDSDTD